MSLTPQGVLVYTDEADIKNSEFTLINEQMLNMLQINKSDLYPSGKKFQYQMKMLESLKRELSKFIRRDNSLDSNEFDNCG